MRQMSMSEDFPLLQSHKLVVIFDNTVVNANISILKM